MELWPAAAWFLMLTFIADWLKLVRSKDFTKKDIIFLHPSTTPFPGGFKCFTCQEAADNYECNRWAPDVYCPQETKYCYTHHQLDSGGNSVSVTKRCGALEDCLDAGCRDSERDGIQVCVSCCEGNICNMALPRNQTDAVFATTSPLNPGDRAAPDRPLLLSSLLFLLVFLSQG